MARAYYKAGLCPKCDGVHTEIKTTTLDDGYRVMAKCNDCGYEDMALMGDDLDLLVLEARNMFSTVVMSDDGGRSKDIPTADDIAHDVSHLIKFICDNIGCSDCPLHKPKSGETPAEGNEGWLLLNSKMGIRCRDQSELTLRKSLVKRYAGL